MTAVGVGVVGFGFFRWSLTTFASPTASSLFSVILTKVRIQRRSAAVEAQRKTLDPGLRRDDGGGGGGCRVRFFSLVADDVCEPDCLISLLRHPDESQDPASFSGRRGTTKDAGSRPSPG